MSDHTHHDSSQKEEIDPARKSPIGTPQAILTELQAIHATLAAGNGIEETKEKELREKQHAKDIEYYAASVDSWFNTCMEMDKSLLTLSAGGIGILVTCLSTNLHSGWELALYIGALALFVGCVGIILFVFRLNAKHLERINNNEPTNEALLHTLDNWAVKLFVLAVIFTAIIGIDVAIRSQKHEVDMTDKIQADRSLKGAEKMQPKEINNGFGGAKKMQPSKDTKSSESTSQKDK